MSASREIYCDRAWWRVHIESKRGRLGKPVFRFVVERKFVSWDTYYASRWRWNVVKTRRLAEKFLDKKEKKGIYFEGYL